MKKYILSSLLLCMTCTITKTMEEDTEIKKLIQKRTFYTALLAATNIAMMGIDIANLYYPEEGPFSQKVLTYPGWVRLFADSDVGKPCDCPSGALSCKISIPKTRYDFSEYTYDCKQTIFNAIGDSALQVVNYGATITRFGLCCSNLYDLYQVQKTLNTQSITEHEKAHNQQTMMDVQGTSGAITSLFTTTAGFFLNGITHYPRTFIVCGANAVVDLLGALNSYENEKAYEEIALLTGKKTS